MPATQIGVSVPDGGRIYLSRRMAELPRPSLFDRPRFEVPTYDRLRFESSPFDRPRFQVPSYDRGTMP